MKMLNFCQMSNSIIIKEHATSIVFHLNIRPQHIVYQYSFNGSVGTDCMWATLDERNIFAQICESWNLFCWHSPLSCIVCIKLTSISCTSSSVIKSKRSPPAKQKLRWCLRSGPKKWIQIINPGSGELSDHHIISDSSLAGFFHSHLLRNRFHYGVLLSK